MFLNRFSVVAITSKWNLLDSCLTKQSYRNSSSKTTIEVNEKNGIRRIVLADEKTKNSLTLKMVSSLMDAVKEGETNSNLRCIVISGKGTVFSSGFNLKELADVSNRKVFDNYTQLMLALINSPVPVIAAVNGLAAAAGCQLVAQCDIAVCTQKSSFSTPGANFGIFCSTPGVPLVRSVGRKSAMHMLFTGHPLSSDEAYKAGLVSHVVPDNELEELVTNITDGIKSKSREVIQLGKQFLYQQLEMDIKSAYETGANVMRRNLELADGVEGIRSFIEKRKPVWKSGL